MTTLPCAGASGTPTVGGNVAMMFGQALANLPNARYVTNSQGHHFRSWQENTTQATDALLKAVKTFGQTIADALKPVLDAIQELLGGEIAIAGQSYREPKVNAQTLALPSYQLLASVRRGILQAMESAGDHGVEAVGYFPTCDATKLNVWLRTRSPARWEDHSAKAVMLAVAGDRLTITTATTEGKDRDRFALYLSDPQFVPALAQRLEKYGIPFVEDA